MPKKTVEKKIFSIDELNPKKHYKIKIKSFDKDKKLIGESPWIMFKTTGKNQAPPNVTNLNANFTGSTLVITWNGSGPRTEKDFKNFRIRISSPDHPGITKDFFNDNNRFTLDEDENRNIFTSFEGTINVTVYSRDTSDNESSGVSITASAEVPEDPTNVKLSASTLGYVVSWDLPTFKNYDYTKVYESTSETGTYAVVRTERGSSTYVPKSTIATFWVKVSHVNKAGAESNLVASVPPSITPIDPVPTDVTPPAVPTSLSWEDAGTESVNGITTAAMRAHWEVSEVTSGYKVRVTEDIVNKDNWEVHDVPASKATVTFKSVSSNVATLTLSAHSFAKDDYVTIFNMGTPFDGKRKITSVTSTTISFSLTTGDITNTVATGDVVISSYTVKELYPGTQYYGAILAYDSANNLTQFVSEGTFTTSGTPATVGNKITISGTSMAFGPNVSGTNDGLFIDSNNYWYNTGSFKAGTTTNNLSWDGTSLRLDGRVIARSGSFSGNIFMSGSGTIDSNTASLIAAPYLDIQSATLSGGVATIVTATTPFPAWSTGDVVLVSEASIQFDGQYTLLSASGNTFTFSLTNYSSASPITNTGKIARFSTGDRVIFNSSGIQGWEDNEVLFSFNRNKTSKIGGWTIRPSKLYAGAEDTAVGLNSSSNSNIRIYAGNDDPEQAPFRVTKNGRLIISPEVGSLDINIALGRVSPGSSTDKRTGLVINDTSGSGIENFWYVPANVSTNSAYFRVGTANGSGITVIKQSGGTSRVKIKDYDIEGVTSIVDDSKITINTVEIGKGVGGAGKHGIKVDDYNYWYDPSTTGFPSDGIVFRAGWTGNKSLTVRKNGEVEFEGTTNPTGGTVKGKLTIEGTTYAFGKDVLGVKDGLYLNDNNYFVVGGGVPEFRVGNDNSFLNWNGSSLSIQVGGSSVATQSQLSLKADATGSAILSLLNTGMGTGVVLTSDSKIYSAGKTSYNSSTAGWYLGRDTVNSVLQYTFGIGNATKYMRWDGSQLLINGKAVGGTELGNNTGVVIDDTSTINGIKVNNVLRITGYSAGSGTSAGSIAFTNTAGDIEKGAVYDSSLNKYTETYSSGRGIAIGSSGFYPHVEVGWDSATGTSNPRIILAAAAVTFSDPYLGTLSGPEIRLNNFNFGIVGDSASYISVPEGTSPVKYMAKNNNGHLRWVDPPSGSGSGTTYTSGDSSEGVIVNNTSDTIRNAGYRMVGNTSGGSSRISTTNRIGFTSAPADPVDGDIWITF